MLLKQVIAGLAITTATSAIGHHGALHGLLQVTPSFSGDSIVLHPGLHPEHNASDVAHLRPERAKNLYYSQEGHRPALHGAKHASLDAVFVRDTVVLDHSSHIKTITCDSSDIHVCFQTLEALDVVTESWVGRDSFNLATYHVGCGDETSGKRSFFHASDLTVYPDTMCAVMTAVPIEEKQALDSGVVTWGTYESPDERRRSEPVKGHIRPVKPKTKPKLRKTPGGKPAPRTRRPISMMRNGNRLYNGTMPGNGSNGTVPIYQDFMDLTTQPVALRTFFNDSKIDTTHMQDEVDVLDFLPMDGEMEKMNTTEMGGHNMTRRHTSLMSRRHAAMIERRGIFTDIWDGLKRLGKLIEDFFTGAARVIATVGELIVNFAVVSVKLLMVPFGVPFDHSMNYDITLDKRLDGLGGGNKPPNIFGIGNGFTLAKTVEHGAEFYVQCAKCGVYANMNLNGRLAFSIRDGVTEGYVEFNNNEEFTLDAQFGISLAGKLATKTWETPVKDRNGRQLTAIPFSPLTIPGIITIGPQGSISVAFTATLEGKAEFLVGGSLNIAPGKARVSVKKKDNNGITGLNVTFTPVLKATGSFTVTGDLGLPIAIECGIDVLNGEFKKTVGLVDTPSIYVQAIASHDPSTPCHNGVEVRLGAKNRIHVAALDLWDYDIRDDIIYEAGLGCVTKDGWDSGKVQPSKTIIDAVIKKSDGDPSKENTPLTDVAKNLTQPPGKQGFRLLMAADEGSILVSGKDGAIYAVDRSENYDLSAPWGTLDLRKNALMLDVFGRIIAYTWLSPLKYNDQDVKVPALAELLVVDPKEVPDEYKACSIAQMSATPQGIKPYGIPLVYEPEIKSQIEGYQEPLHKPTVCKTQNGLRLYATRDTITKEGRVMADNGYEHGYLNEYWEDLLQTYVGVGLEECRTLRLTSDIRGTTK